MGTGTIMSICTLTPVMPSSQITFKGRPIFSIGQPKQVQPTNTFIDEDQNT